MPTVEHVCTFEKKNQPQIHLFLFRFLPFIPDSEINPAVEKILLCTGRIYYDLKHERQKRGLEKKVSIGRIEQISPFPYQTINEYLKR